MSSRRTLYGVALLILGGGVAFAENVVYVPAGATWKLFRGVDSAPTAGAEWTARTYDDSGWEEGAAPVGYGEADVVTDLSVLDPPMQLNYTTVYFRKTFSVSNPDEVIALRVLVDYDDGLMVWVNGQPVVSENAPATSTFDGLAPANHESGAFEEYDLPDPSTYLVAGTNVIAVHGFNYSARSSDFKVNLELFDPFGPDLAPPVVETVTPAGGSLIRSLTQIEVTFSEEVQGVDASDLIVAAQAAQSVTGVGRGPYVFRFPQPANGSVGVAWSAGHGITDSAPAANAFGGGSWSYTLDPSAPEADLVISEFAASNPGPLRDEDQDTSDWIEIHNRGTVAVDVGGWSLTDDEDETDQWILPSRNLAPGSYLLVFASGKDRAPGGSGELHANFQLNSDGEYVGLYTPESPRRVVSQYAPEFPQQRAGFSYGIHSQGEVGYFSVPTPGAPNGSSAVLEGIVTDPRVFPPRGFYDGPISVELFTPTPAATIRYTLDGREPTATTGTVYSAPFEVRGTATKASVTVRAAAFRNGFLPSRVMTHTYIDPQHVLTQPANPAGFPTNWGSWSLVDYGMDPEVVNDPAYRDVVVDGLLAIPTLSIVMDTNDMFGSSGLYSNPTGDSVQWERATSVELIYPSGRDGFQADCGIRIQGGASREPNKSAKHSLRFLFKGDYGPSRLRFPFFPDSKVTNFDTITLRANYNNSWVHWDSGQRGRGSLIRDQWVRDAQLATGQLSSHGTYMHVYVNGLYWGVYNPVERPTGAFAAEYLGGEKEEYDALNSAVAKDGNLLAWNAMNTLASRDLSSQVNYEALEAYLDVPGLIDYMILNVFGGNDDWPHHNWYAVRRRMDGAQYKFVSWDAERIFEGTGVNRVSVNNANSPAYFYDRLRASAEYRLQFADHLHRHFFNGGVLTPDVVAERWMTRADELDLAVVCESARWGDYRRDVHSSSNGPYEFYRKSSHWLPEQQRLLTQYFPVRSGIVLNQFKASQLYPNVDAPVFSQHGGTINPGYALSMTLPGGGDGSIYYTTDSTDPRVSWTGGVSLSAKSYSGPVTLQDTTIVKARTRDGTQWSALNEAVFSVLDPADALRVTEILYHAPGGSQHDFLELQNVADFAVDLSGLSFSNGIQYAFAPGRILGPGEYFVLVADYFAFTDLYPDVEVDGVYLGSLDNSGEKITLQNAADETILSVEYGDSGDWPIGPDGFGYSLVAIGASGDPDDPQTWRASAEPLGSPGASDPTPEHGGVIVHELLANAEAPLEDAVELHNRTSQSVQVGGWYLSDSRADAASLRKFRIPSNTMIPAGGFTVLYANQFTADPEGPTSFELPASGGSVYLASANAAGALTGHIVGRRFDATAPGSSLGVTVTSQGLDFTRLESRTFGVDDPATVEEFRGGKGAPNSPPLVGPIVIHEIHYHPDFGGDEFVELHNVSGEPVAVGGWRLRGVRNAEDTESYEFPAGAEIPAGGYAVVAGIEPDTFRARYSVPVAAIVYGPFNGTLDNGGEKLELLEPTADSLAFVVIDDVRYNDRAPWPLEADGAGPSLERVRSSEYGNDPVNWAASVDDGGTPGRLNSNGQSGVNQRPIASFLVQADTDSLIVRLDASSSTDPDGSIIDYRWSFGDGATGSGVTVVHEFAVAGSYLVSLTVEDNAGAKSTATRSVTVSEPGEGGWQRPGDGNQDSALDISDAVVLLLHLFVGSADPLPCGGSSPLDGGNRTVFDVNQDTLVDLTDAVYTLNFLFQGGPEPVLGMGCVRILGCPDACAP